MGGRPGSQDAGQGVVSEGNAELTLNISESELRERVNQQAQRMELSPEVPLIIYGTEEDDVTPIWCELGRS